MVRSSFRTAFAGLAIAICTVSGVAQTFDDPTSALGAPQGDGVYAFNSSGYSIAGPGMFCNLQGSDVNDVWLAYIPAVTGNVIFTTCPGSSVSGGSFTGGGAPFNDSALAVWDDFGGAPNAIQACADGSPNCGFTESEVNVAVTAGNVYYVQVTDWTGSSVISGNIAIGALPPPGPGDDCTLAYTQVGPGLVPLVATTASSGGAASCAGGPDFGDQWISYTATLTGIAYASTCSTSPNAPGGTNAGIFTYVAAYTSCPAGFFTDIACDFGNGPCGFGGGGEAAFPCTAGTTYFIQCGDWSSFGSVAGVTVAINELLPPPPAGPGDDCTVAVPLTIGTPTPYNSTGFTAFGPQSNCSAIGGFDPFDFWFSFTAPATGTAVASNCPGSSLAGGGSASPTDTYLSAWDGASCPPTFELACADGSPNCGVAESEVQFPVTAGQTYFVQVGTWGNSQANAGAVNIAVILPPVNDDCASATPISVGSTIGNNIGATTSSPTGSCASNGNDVWYSFVVPCSGKIILDTCGSGLDTVLSVFDNCPGNEIGCNDQAGGVGPCQFSSASYLEIPNTGGILTGTTIYISVGGWLSQTGGFTLNVTCDYTHRWTTPLGAGSVQLENVDGPPNAIAISAMTVDIVHPGLPANVQFPNGWFFGIPIGFQELQIQLLWPGGLPFIGLLDSNGYLLNFTLPFGTTSGLAGIATVWSVGVGLDPLTGFSSVADTTDPTAFPL